MKRISLEQLEKKVHAKSYEQLCRYVYAQIESGALKPVPASKTNGKKPALYREYRVVEQETDYGFYEEELKYNMSTRISIDYYMRHLAQYVQDRKWVLMLNAYLLQAQGAGSAEMVSKNERSFQIWGREKFLQMEQGRKILKRCGIDASQLSFYETSEPLAYYGSHRHVPQNLLILENKDTFYSMRRHFLDGGSEIFGVSFGTLIYGAGKGILRSFQDFSFCVEPYMRAAENRIYYFGDLDYEGIGIYERLAEAFEAREDAGADMPAGDDVPGACEPFGQRRIAPFVEAYARMLAKGQAVLELPQTKEGQNKKLSGRFFGFFSKEVADGMREILESGRYIPQEILNIGDFA